MAFSFNDLALAATSAVSDATTTQDGVTFDMVVSAAERRALQELSANAGRVASYATALGPTVALDATGGFNTLYVTSGATTQTDSGWFAVRGVNDSWEGRTTHSRLRLDLVRLASSDNGVGESNAYSEFLAHDF